MKKYIHFIALLIGFTSMAQGQGPDHDRRMAKDKIDALAVAFFTEELELTPDEATKFWPVFNELKDKRYEIDRKRRQIAQDIESKFKTLTDREAASYVDRLTVLEKQKYEASFEYNRDKFIDIIGAKRFLKLMNAERDFRRKLLREYKDRKTREKH